MTYAWIIDKDYIADPSVPVGSYCNAPGVTGPSDAPDSLTDRLEGSKVGIKFRIYDDDGELCYAGRILFSEPCSGFDDLPEEAFGPLEDFGTPNAGATEIRFFNQGKWVQL